MMSASRTVEKDTDEIVGEIVGEEYMSFQEIYDEADARKEGSLTPSAVRNELETPDYDRALKRIEGDLEVEYRRAD